MYPSVLPRSPRTSAPFLLLAALALGTLSCAGDGGGVSRGPTSTTSPVTTPADEAAALVADVAAEPIDTRSVELPPVEGQGPPESIEVSGGDAHLEGTVAHAGEPVEGATVRLERHVGQMTASLDVETGAGGYWSAPDLHGGHYVVRAWQEPDLALERARPLFLGEDERREVHVALVRIEPAAGPEDDAGDGSEDAGGEDEDASEGDASDDASEDGEDGDGPEVAEVAVGDTISVPVSGAIPAGTYESADAHFCETVYERWVGDRWEERPQVARGWTLGTSTSIRALRAAPGSEPCTYERVS